MLRLARGNLNYVPIGIPNADRPTPAITAFTFERASTMDIRHLRRCFIRLVENGNIGQDNQGREERCENPPWQGLAATEPQAQASARGFYLRHRNRKLLGQRNETVFADSGQIPPPLHADPKEAASAVWHGDEYCLRQPGSLPDIQCQRIAQSEAVKYVGPFSGHELVSALGPVLKSCGCAEG